MPTQPVIVLDEVNKTFESAAGTFQALRDVSLTIDAGEFVAITGRSGSGKSTLINMLTGMDRPTSGGVIANGAVLNAMNENELAVWRGRHLGVIFQFFQLLPTLTVLDNVVLPMDFANTYPKKERPARALALLEQFDLAEHASKLPSRLSGGQQQRAAIARALANDPPLLAADEPTGNLDSVTAESVFEVFQKLVAGGKTILMVTHDAELASRTSRQIELLDGRVITGAESGAHVATTLPSGN